MSLSVNELRQGIIQASPVLQTVSTAEDEFVRIGRADTRRIGSLGLGPQPSLLTNTTAISFLRLQKEIIALHNLDFTRYLEEEVFPDILEGTYNLDLLPQDLTEALALYAIALGRTYKIRADFNSSGALKESLMSKLFQCTRVAQILLSKDTGLSEGRLLQPA